MYSPIQLTHIPSRVTKEQEDKFLKEFKIDFFDKEKIKESEEFTTNILDDIFTEAVFAGGRESLEPLIQVFQSIKDALENDVKTLGSNFDPGKYYKNTVFRDLEDQVIKIFGFRDAHVYGWFENYNKTDDIFSSMELNCYTYPPSYQRFTIESIVTDKGFYDTTHTLRVEISFSLGLIRECTAEELVAIFIHEFGHNIDPAIIDIKYTETNILSKYLTDRENKITNYEQGIINKVEKDNKGNGFIGLLVVAGFLLLSELIKWVIRRIKIAVFKPEKAIEKIKNIIRSDKDQFTRQSNSEAFADNFARMYGMGYPLMNALKRMGDYGIKRTKSRIKKEKERQFLYAEMITWVVKDVHKTDIHRYYNLIKEYKADLNDPNIPDEVKKAIQTDMDELQILLDQYLNSEDAFRNRVNKLILDELKSLDDISNDAAETPQVTEPTPELPSDVQPETSPE